MRRVTRFLFFLFVLLFLSVGAFAQSSPSPSSKSQSTPAYTKVDELNRGLENFPQVARDKLTTPERSLAYFVSEARQGNFGKAAYVLNLNRLSLEAQRAHGADLARKLYQVMDRQMGFPFERLPDRFDGKRPPTPTSSNQLGGEPRGAFQIGTLPLEVGEMEVYLMRYRSEEVDDVWLFAPGTVDRINEAYELAGPRPWEQNLPGWLKQHTISRTPIWAWVALGMVIGVSFLAAQVTIKVVGHFVGVDLVSRLSKGLIMLTACWLPYLSLGFWVPLPDYVRYILLFLGFCAVVWLVSTTLNYYSESLIRSDIDSVEDLDDVKHSQHKQTLTYLSVGRRLLSFLVFAIGIGVVALKIPNFETVGLGLLASAGVLSVLLGVAAQPILGNIISGLQIAISRPIRVGDSLTYDGVWCYVEDITYMYVLCRTWDEKRLIVPLRYFTTNPFKSDSLRDPRTMQTIEMKLDYTLDVEAIRQEYERLVADSPSWDSAHEPKLEVIAFNDATITIRAVVWSRNASASWDLHCEIREKLLHYLQKQQRHALPRRRLHADLDGNGHTPLDRVSV